MKRALLATTAVAAGLAIVPVATMSTASAATRKPGADMRAKISAPKTVKRGKTITYTAKIRNNGPRNAYATFFVGTLPKGLTKVRFSGKGSKNCQLKGRDVGCYLGKAKPYDTSTVRVTAKVTKKAPKVLKADLGIISLETRDPNYDNNHRLVTTRVRG